MAKKYRLSAKDYRKAARQLAFQQAMLVAAIVTTFTALGFLLAESPYPLIVWGFEFLITLALAYYFSLQRIKKDAADLLDPQKKRTYELSVRIQEKED